MGLLPWVNSCGVVAEARADVGDPDLVEDVFQAEFGLQFDASQHALTLDATGQYVMVVIRDKPDDSNPNNPTLFVKWNESSAWPIQIPASLTDLSGPAGVAVDGAYFVGAKIGDTYVAAVRVDFRAMLLTESG